MMALASSSSQRRAAMASLKSLLSHASSPSSPHRAHTSAVVSARCVSLSALTSSRMRRPAAPPRHMHSIVMGGTPAAALDSQSALTHLPWAAGASGGAASAAQMVGASAPRNSAGRRAHAASSSSAPCSPTRARRSATHSGHWKSEKPMRSLSAPWLVRTVPQSSVKRRCLAWSPGSPGASDSLACRTACTSSSRHARFSLGARPDGCSASLSADSPHSSPAMTSPASCTTACWKSGDAATSISTGRQSNARPTTAVRCMAAELPLIPSAITGGLSRVAATRSRSSCAGKALPCRCTAKASSGCSTFVLSMEAAAPRGSRSSQVHHHGSRGQATSAASAGQASELRCAGVAAPLAAGARTSARPGSSSGAQDFRGRASISALKR
mmetsp:Transcript_54451/g.153338  ORF Transcript_54451/g.153338 Transcript_54451/m.153338 type:complete len:384 (-) Transcript_54451:154-1305(-)